MGYGVEVSRGIVGKAKPLQRARRGLDKAVILDAAFAMFATEGEEGFSVRKLSASIGVDPMTVLHHFQSKNELLRQIADRSLMSVALPKPSRNWQSDLRRVADAYRDLAYRNPRLFHLHFRFHATGPVDHLTSEVVYRAMRSSGVSDATAAGLGLAFYAFVLGFSLSETEGLVRPISDNDVKELMALDPETCPATQALVPSFKALNPDAAFDAAMTAFISGVAGMARKKPNFSAAVRNGNSKPATLPQRRTVKLKKSAAVCEK